MDQPRPYTGQFKQYAFVWKPEFGQRQTGRAYTNENVSRVERLLGVEFNTAEVIETFVDNQCHQDIHRYFYMKQVVEGFLEFSDLQVLKDGLTDPLLKPLALMDDRNDAKGSRDAITGNFRLSQSGMNAAQLYAQLLKPRVSLPEIPDAERRLIYINDLDPLCTLALAATASNTQAAFLRDFIYKHLAYRALIGVEIVSLGTPRFAMEFHLPYYAWRQSDQEEEDFNANRRVDGRPMRRSEEVIFLQLKNESILTKDDNQKAYIHEAQISLMITGIDDWFWTAYCFVDVYFQGTGHTESIEDYAAGSRDPLSCGKTTFRDKPAWLPRQYFLQILTYRMEHVKQEWNNSVYQLLKQIQPYIHSFTRGETKLFREGELNITQQKGFRWTIRVLRQFTHLLSKTIDSWETFKDGEMRYFNLPDSESLAQASWGRYLAAIDKDVIELRDLRSSLLHQTELFENMTNSIVTHAAHAETIITRLQTQFLQALTVITIFYLPPTLASTIFSMQSILPAKVDFYHWIYTLIGLFVATLLLVVNLQTIISLGGPLKKLLNWPLRRLQQFIQRRNALSKSKEDIELQEV